MCRAFCTNIGCYDNHKLACIGVAITTTTQKHVKMGCRDNYKYVRLGVALIAQKCLKYGLLWHP